ncbi:MAG: hypothetical protein NTW46_02865 [Candidatus Nealsonbacteria bacterium]|nr:hypothetical protein [Candidatus Nealsonbacteria bacterium]
MIGRQTGLELRELIEKARNPHTTVWPICMILNEIGEICAKNDGLAQEGEDFLVKTLDSLDIQHRAIAFSFLSLICKKTQRHSQLLADFRSKPNNAKAVEMVDARMEELEIV